jgi:hypothetical protein
MVMPDRVGCGGIELFSFYQSSFAEPCLFASSAQARRRKRRRFVIHFVALVFVVFLDRMPVLQATADDRSVREIKKDMTADEVQSLIGKPGRVARQILFRRHLEQWIYDDMNAVVEFNCRASEEPRVVQVFQNGAPLK